MFKSFGFSRLAVSASLRVQGCRVTVTEPEPDTIRQCIAELISQVLALIYPNGVAL